MRIGATKKRHPHWTALFSIRHEAGKEGFEPSVLFPAHSLSRRARSTTLAPPRVLGCSGGGGSRTPVRSRAIRFQVGAVWPLRHSSIGGAAFSPTTGKVYRGEGVLSNLRAGMGLLAQERWGFRKRRAYRAFGLSRPLGTSGESGAQMGAAFALWDVRKNAGFERSDLPGFLNPGRSPNPGTGFTKNGEIPRSARNDNRWIFPACA